MPTRLGPGGGSPIGPSAFPQFVPPQGFIPVGSGFERDDFRSGDFGGQLGDLGQGQCERLGVPASICALGRAAIERFLGGGGEGSASPGTLGLAPGCPRGFERDENGNCIRQGVRGVVERILPGGRSGTLADRFGEATLGAFGIPGIFPAQVGSRSNARGEVNPILECPPGAVLGKDNICYMKGSIPRKFRKWPPAPRAPVTAQDAKAIRKAASARKRVKKLAGNVGFKCQPKRGG